MVTKAELEAQLAELKRERAERERAAGKGAERDPAATGADDTAAGMKAALEEALRAHGIDTDDLDLDKLWQQVSEEAGALARERPALTAIAIFALGFVLGRMSK